MALLKNIPYLIIGFLLLYILFLQECKRPKVVNPTTKVDTIVLKDTFYQPTIKDSIVYSTIYKDKVSYVYDTFVDTVYVIKDYLTKYYYQDTILSDSNGLIVIMDTIYRNRIKSRQNYVRLYPKRFVETYTPKIKIFVGLRVYSNIERSGINGSIAMLTKNDNLYSIGYDPFNKNVLFSAYYKISFKKK